MKVIFHHTPKTAGKYVRVALQEAGFQHRHVGWQSERSGRAHIDDHQDGNVVWTSHWAFHPSVFTPKEDELYITWVRHPVDMVYSAYAWLRIHPPSPGEPRPQRLFERIAEHGTLEGYIDVVLASERPFYPEGIFTGMDLRAFDYVGCADWMPPSLGGLQMETGVEIPTPLYPVNASGAIYTYRRADLEARLKPEIEAVEPWL